MKKKSLNLFLNKSRINNLTTSEITGGQGEPFCGWNIIEPADGATLLDVAIAVGPAELDPVGYTIAVAIQYQPLL